ncbi:hypothetical protein [Gaiella occulta]|uniref:hypothetical protein n=1 Tax=Gaiella occulta TaxID=1002870 RepID=UPI0011C07912|nr:hypothetical protein [Gaiella occulta]
MSAARIVGAGETSYLRHPSEESSTARVLADASRLALKDGGLDPGEIDGLGVASFTLTAIAEVPHPRSSKFLS